MNRLIPCTCMLKACVAHMSLCRNGKPTQSRLLMKSSNQRPHACGYPKPGSPGCVRKFIGFTSFSGKRSSALTSGNHSNVCRLRQYALLMSASQNLA